MNFNGLINNANKLKRQYTRQDRLYTTAELTAEFGIKEWFWKELIRRRKIEPIRVGRRYYVDSDGLESFMNKWCFSITPNSIS
jgi:hypothetical protein